MWVVSPILLFTVTPFPVTKEVETEFLQLTLPAPTV